MYEPTFSVSAIGRDEPVALKIGIESMGFLLEALVKINASHLRRFPNKTPRMFALAKEGLLRYDELEPEEGSVCGDDKWADIPTILDTKDRNGVSLADCEDLAAWRSAEANEIFRVGKQSGKKVPCQHCKGRGFVSPEVTPFVFLRRDWIKDEDGNRRRRHLYHVVCKWPEGLSKYPNSVERYDGHLLEDPSKLLGM